MNADSVLARTGEYTLAFNMFVYCFNNPVNYIDQTGCWPQWIEDIGEAIENIGDAIGDFFENTWDALSQSFSISGEVGYGFGINGKVGIVAVNVAAVILGDEWSLDSNGAVNSKRKASLTVEAKIIDNISAGVDLEYNVPIAAGKEKGLLCAGGGKFEAALGLKAFSAIAGYSTTSTSDVELSLGFAGYLVMGGGFEISFNLSKFWRLWTD